LRAPPQAGRSNLVDFGEIATSSCLRQDSSR